MSNHNEASGNNDTDGGTAREHSPTGHSHQASQREALPGTSASLDTLASVAGDFPKQIFDLLLANNPLVCDNCYLRRASRHQVPNQVYGTPTKDGEDRGTLIPGRDLQWAEIDYPPTHDPDANAYPGMDDDVDFYVTDELFSRSYTVQGADEYRPGQSQERCSGCSDLDRNGRNMTKRDLLLAAGHASETLYEYGIRHDSATIQHAAERFADNPNLATPDERPLRGAVVLAIEEATYFDTQTSGRTTHGSPETDTRDINPAQERNRQRAAEAND